MWSVHELNPPTFAPKTISPIWNSSTTFPTAATLPQKSAPGMNVEPSSRNGAGLSVSLWSTGLIAIAWTWTRISSSPITGFGAFSLMCKFFSIPPVTLVYCHAFIVWAMVLIVCCAFEGGCFAMCKVSLLERESMRRLSYQCVCRRVGQYIQTMCRRSRYTESAPCVMTAILQRGYHATKPVSASRHSPHSNNKYFGHTMWP